MTASMIELATPTPGPVLFARYAYPPNALGYCGPGDPEALLSAAAARANDATLAHLASQFEGAWPYLQLIATCNGITDPLDRRVVEAYWIGNGLLRGVPSAAFAASLNERFARRAGRHFDSIASSAVALGGVAHHNFHVFAVYPWLGLLRAGMEGAPLIVLDRCRVRWGTVEAVLGDLVVVRSRRLLLRGARLELAETEEEEVVRGAISGLGFVDDLKPGDVVSMHWDWICDRLSAKECARLERVTARNLAAVNALAAPGPVVAIDRFGGPSDSS